MQRLLLWVAILARLPPERMVFAVPILPPISPAVSVARQRQPGAAPSA